MDEGPIKTHHPKCRLHWCLIEFIDWSGDTVSHVGIFDPSCELLPFYLLSDLPHPSPPSQSKCTVYKDSVWLCGGGVVELSCVVDLILQEFNPLFLMRFRTYTIATPPNKNDQ
jgi:hypothetical protein